MIDLTEINQHNWPEALHLRVTPEQLRYVADPAGILARAYAYRDCRAQVWGIRQDGAPRRRRRRHNIRRSTMRIDFNEMPPRRGPGLNGGTGELTARLYMDEQGKIIPCRIHPGGSIGSHHHPGSDDINYILSGTGMAVCDGQEEALAPGVCHICKKGSQHSIVNTGSDDLVMLTIVVER